MQIRIYFVAALLALVTALSPNLSPTAAQGDIPTIMFPAKLNKDQVSFGLVRMMQKAGCYFDVYREDIRVFLRTRASPICVIDPKVRLPILSREKVTIANRSERPVGLAFTANYVAFPNTPNEHSEEVTHGEIGRSIHMKLDGLRASLEDPKAVGFEAIH